MKYRDTLKPDHAMIRANVERTDEGTIHFEVYLDGQLRLVSIIYPYKKDMVKVRSAGDFDDMTAAEMHDLWWELKKSYLSPPVIMERIRADVLKHLQDVGRVDLVAVCLDNASYGGVSMRL